MNSVWHLRDVLPLWPSPNFSGEAFFSGTSDMPEGEIPEYCAPHLIFLVQAGSHLHRTQGYLDGRRFSDAWPPGLLTFYPQGTRIRAEWKGQTRKAWLELYPASTPSGGDETLLRRLPKLHPNYLYDDLIRDTVLLMSGCITNPDSGEPLYRELLMARLMAHLEMPASNPDWALHLNKATILTPMTLRRAKDYAHGHLERTFTLQSWAREMHMNTFHFARAFKATTGMSPYQYVIDQRIQRGRLMLEGGVSVTEVASRLRFSSASHFGAIFKRRVGVTPSRWIETHMTQRSSIFRSLKAFEFRNIYRPASIS